jgi:L-fuculose-phosphate aldolase
VDADDPRFLVAAAARILSREGCASNVGGQVSVRAEGGAGAFWVFGYEYFDQATPDRVALIDQDLQVIEGRFKLPAAMGTLARIYSERPDVNAIVHLHSHYVTVLSGTGRPVGMYDISAVLFHDDQATYADDGRKPHHSVVDALGDRRVVLIKNHGAIVASESLRRATVEAVTLEESARIHLESESAGASEIAPDEVARGKGAYRLLYLEHMWEANWERLSGSDPDLWSLLDEG